MNPILKAIALIIFRLGRGPIADNNRTIYATGYLQALMDVRDEIRVYMSTHDASDEDISKFFHLTIEGK